MKKVYAILFVSMLIVNMGFMLYGFASEQLVARSELVSMSKYNGSDYVKKQEITNKDEIKKDDGVYVRVNQLLERIKNASRILTQNYSFASTDIVKVNVLVQNVMGVRIEHLNNSNTIYAIDDIIVPFEDGYYSYIADDIDIEYPVNAITVLSNELKERDIQFLYVETPFKFDESCYAGMYVDYSRDIQDKIVGTLRDYGVDVLSLTEEMNFDGLTKREQFFKTDHHWLPQTGIWACGKVVDRLNLNYGYNIDSSVFNLDNYDISFIKDSFLGSQGRKLTEVYCNREDFPIVIPLYETDLTVYNSYSNTTLSGTLEETLLWDKALETQYMYDYYGYGDQALISVSNNFDTEDDHRVLIVKASFADCMVPYLAVSGIDQIDVIDLRQFQGSLMTYIDETKPDTVIMIYGLTSFYPKFYDTFFDFN